MMGMMTMEAPLEITIRPISRRQGSLGEHMNERYSLVLFKSLEPVEGFDNKYFQTHESALDYTEDFASEMAQYDQTVNVYCTTLEGTRFTRSYA